MHESLRALRGIELPERYEFIHHVADGGMASVWRTRDRVLGREVAIKLLSPAYAQDEEAVRRFEREGRAAARVSGHRHVVTIYDVGSLPPEDRDSDAIPFIAMEYLSGGSVHSALADGPVEPETALRWLRDTASALDHAHEHGVVHRDIKPGNLLLNEAGSVHVADFGIARIAAETSITTVGHVLGTAAYLAPEQALGRPATPDGDRYSLAVVAYELLTGSRPFDGNRLASLRDSRAAFRPTPATTRNPELPPAVDAVLARGLARVPTRRWPSATEFVRRLERAFTLEPASALAEPATTLVEPATVIKAPTTPPPAAPFVAYGTRRRRSSAWAAPLAIVAVIALGVGIAAGASSGPSAKPAKGATTANTRAGASGRTVASRKHNPHHTGVAAHAATTSTPTPQTPSQLDARGHAMMLAGNYTGAIAAMRQVLAETPSTSLLHAYALFDLGHSLRLAGDPRAAIPVLEQRLRYPNQTGVVRAELLLAERAAGLVPPAGPGPGPAGHGHHGHGPAGGGPPGQQGPGGGQD
jgi:hypothetical protein